MVVVLSGIFVSVVKPLTNPSRVMLIVDTQMRDDFAADFMEKFKARKVEVTMFERNKITAPFQAIMGEQAITSLVLATIFEFNIRLTSERERNDIDMPGNVNKHRIQVNDFVERFAIFLNSSSHCLHFETFTVFNVNGLKVKSNLFSSTFQSLCCLISMLIARCRLQLHFIISHNGSTRTFYF